MDKTPHTFGVRPSGGAWVGVERIDGTDDLLTARHRSAAAARRALKRRLREFVASGLIPAVPRSLPVLS